MPVMVLRGINTVQRCQTLAQAGIDSRLHSSAILPSSVCTEVNGLVVAGIGRKEFIPVRVNIASQRDHAT